MQGFLSRNGSGQLGASPEFSPLNSGVSARILGLSPNYPPERCSRSDDCVSAVENLCIIRASLRFSHLLVTKRRKGRPDKARDRGPRKRTVGYVEEADRGGTRFAGRAVRAEHCADAVDLV